MSGYRDYGRELSDLKVALQILNTNLVKMSKSSTDQATALNRITFSLVIVTAILCVVTFFAVIIGWNSWTLV